MSFANSETRDAPGDTTVAMLRFLTEMLGSRVDESGTARGLRRAVIKTLYGECDEHDTGTKMRAGELRKLLERWNERAEGVSKRETIKAIWSAMTVHVLRALREPEEDGECPISRIGGPPVGPPGTPFEKGPPKYTTFTRGEGEGRPPQKARAPMTFCGVLALPEGMPGTPRWLDGFGAVAVYSADPGAGVAFRPVLFLAKREEDFEPAEAPSLRERALPLSPPARDTPMFATSGGPEGSGDTYHVGPVALVRFGGPHLATGASVTAPLGFGFCYRGDDEIVRKSPDLTLHIEDPSSGKKLAIACDLPEKEPEDRTCVGRPTCWEV